MRAGLAYDSDAGRALAASVSALAHAAAISESAALAEAKQAYPEWSKSKRAEEAAVKIARDAAASLKGAIAARAQTIYRGLPGAKNAGLRVSVSIAFARDIGLYRAQGYDVEAIRVFDSFPLTHRVECVALLIKAG